MRSREELTTAGSLFIKATILAAKWAGATRRRALESLACMSIADKDRKIVFLRDQNQQPRMQVSILQKNTSKKARSPRYTLAERLHVLWFMEAFQIPRRKVTDCLGIARSTFYRWLNRIEGECHTPSPPPDRTPNEITLLAWEISRLNLSRGRVRIANQLGLLGAWVNTAAFPSPKESYGSRPDSVAATVGGFSAECARTWSRTRVTTTRSTKPATGIRR